MPRSCGHVRKTHQQPRVPVPRLVPTGSEWQAHLCVLQLRSHLWMRLARPKICTNSNARGIEKKPLRERPLRPQAARASASAPKRQVKTPEFGSSREAPGSACVAVPVHAQPESRDLLSDPGAPNRFLPFLWLLWSLAHAGSPCHHNSASRGS